MSAPGTATVTVNGTSYTGGVTKRVIVYVEQAIASPITAFDPERVEHQLAMTWAIAKSKGYEGDFDSFLDADVEEIDAPLAEAFASADTDDVAADPFASE